MTEDQERRGRTSSGERVDAGVARDLSALARQMQAADSADALLELIVRAAVSESDGAAHAGVMLVTKGRVGTEATTDDLVEKIDQLQYDAGEGPCLSALGEQLTVRSDDLAREQRWPKFARAAFELGIGSMLSVQLFAQADNLGALNLYATRAHAFTGADENVALLLASHAAVAMAGARKLENLRIALDSRDVIGQAKGILMERFKINAAQAFGMLVAVSQHHQRKVAAVAEQLASTGEMIELD